MVTQGIMLGHIISSRGLEVDKAKVEAIKKLPTPRNVKDIKSFLGHTGFYRGFKDIKSQFYATCYLRMFHLNGHQIVRMALRN